MKRAELRPLVGDLRQLASIRRIVLDDGPERGVRALAFSTGGGLDFWVLSDRSLDIGPVWVRGVPIAWQGPVGFSSAALHNPESDAGHGFTRSFSGFLVTCGLDHVRQPLHGHPLHGRLPFTPARLLSYGEDWDRAEPILFCEGEVIQARYGGEALRLRRRIEAPIGGSEIRIEDCVENLGPEASPQAMLYHFNLGFPAVATGTEIRLEGERILGPIVVPNKDDRPTSISYPAAQAAEACCTVRTPSSAGEEFVLALSFATASLPHLQIWHDLRPTVGVLAIEPCTSERQADGESGPERSLAPSERRRYALRIGFRGAPARLQRQESVAVQEGR